MINVEVIVEGPSGETVETAITEVTSRAAELALSELRDVWPERTGRSRAGLYATDDAVLGRASYTDQVRARGSRIPIVDSLARDIGERAADRAASESDIEAALDAALTDILTQNMEAANG